MRIKNKVRKITAVILVVTMIFIMPRYAICANQNTENALFVESFDNGSILWKLSDMAVNDGKLISTSANSVCSAELKGTSKSLWSDYEINLCFSFSEFKGGWTQLHIGGEKFILRPSGIWDYSDGKERIIKSFGLSCNENYILNVISKSGNVSLCLKNDHEKICESSFISSGSGQKGGIRILTYMIGLKIDSIAVTDNKQGLKINKKILALGVSQEVQLKANIPVKQWTSSDEGVITTDADGNITAVGKGEATITAVDENGNTDICNFVVFVKPESAYFNYDLSSLTIGENFGVSLKLIPEDASMDYIVWESTDNEILNIVGNLNNRKTIEAKKSGAACININSIDGKGLLSCPIMVFDKKENNNKQTAYAQLSINGKKISDKLFGVHCPSPQILTGAQKALVTEFGFDFLRTFSADPLNKEVYTAANENNIPVVVGLNVMNKTVDELTADVAAMHDNLKNNSTIYVELGNEVYNNRGNPDFADEYIVKCTEISNALRQYAENNSFKIKIAACILTYEFAATFPETHLYGIWNKKISQNSDFYDAVVIHNYTTFDNCDGMTQNDAMKFMYGHNEYSRKIFANYEELFPEKEFWYTEYGNYISDLFYASDKSERARLQFGNGIGVALSNMEKLMDMAEHGIDMSSYHCLVDLQGFGIVDSDMFKYPNYYTFKKCAELFDECDYIYSAEKVYSNSEFLRRSAIINEYSDIGVYGFGDADNVKYVVISNRSTDSISFSLKGYDLKPIWSYGGEDVLEKFLTMKDSMYVRPENVPEPKSFDSDASESILLDGYSMTVCKLSETDNKNNFYVSLNKDVFNPMCEKIKVSGVNGAADCVKLYSENDGMVTVFTPDGISEIKPADGFKYNADYKLIAGDCVYRFRTIDKPLFENIKRLQFDSFDTETSNWRFSFGKWSVSDGMLNKNSIYTEQVLSSTKYKNYTLKFDIYPKDIQDGYAEVRIREGFIRLMFGNRQLRSYYNNKNDKIIGILPQYDTGLSVKVVVYGNYIFVWAKNITDNDDYDYVGKIVNVNECEHNISFGGGKRYSLDNIEILTIAGTENVLLDDDFSENFGNWNISYNAWKVENGRLVKYNNNSIQTTSNNVYNNYTITFDLIPDESSADYAEVALKNGFIRFNFKNKQIRTYYNGINDKIVGYFKDFDTKLSVKLKVTGEKIHLWYSTDEENEWIYTTEIDSQFGGESTVSFRGGGQYAVDNVYIKDSFQKEITDIIFLEQNKSGTFSIARPLNNCTVKIIGNDRVGTIVAAVYNKNKMVKLYESDIDTIDNISMRSNDNIRLFLWDSLNGMIPLSGVYSSPDCSFFE